jgi:methionine synthase II (cobalamin-independent)
MQARNRILQELRALTAPQISQLDEPAIRDRLQALREHDRQSASELQKAYEALDEVLDLRQQARFRLFEELLERRKIDLLKRAQQGAARRR